MQEKVLIVGSLIYSSLGKPSLGIKQTEVVYMKFFIVNDLFYLLRLTFVFQWYIKWQGLGSEPHIGLSNLYFKLKS